MLLKAFRLDLLFRPTRLLPFPLSDLFLAFNEYYGNKHGCFCFDALQTPGCAEALPSV